MVEIVAVVGLIASDGLVVDFVVEAAGVVGKYKLDDCFVAVGAEAAADVSAAAGVG